MRRTRCRAATALVGGAAVLAAAAVLGVPGAGGAAGAALMPRSATPAVAAASLVGVVPASQQLTIQVWLEPDLAGAATFADKVATPGRAEFPHYLSPNAYTASFGPSAAHAAAIAAWLTASGLTQVNASSGRDYVSATGPVSKVQSAFGAQINRYRVKGANGEPTVIQSNDRDVSVPASLAPDVLGVTGLSNARAAASQTAAQPAAKAPTCSQYWAQLMQPFHPAYRGLTRGLLAVCGYSAGQIRAAYGATWTNRAKARPSPWSDPGDRRPRCSRR